MKRKLIRNILLGTALSTYIGLAQTSFFEEDLQLSRPYRDENYHQFSRYIDAMTGQSGLLLRLKSRIGYPAPGFYESARKPRLVRIGEDAIGVYYRIWIPVAPELDTYGLYIVPKTVERPAPLVIAMHGGSGMPEIALFHEGSNYHDMIRGAVQRGYVVWAPLIVMSPSVDRRTSNSIPVEVRSDLDSKLRNIGTTLMGLEVTKLTHSLDRVVERPEVDPSRIAMIGLSFGGYYSLYVSAIDPRIKVAIASCSFRNTPAAINTGGQPIDITSPEQVALLVPRPLQIQVGLRDPNAPIDTVRETAAIARKYYESANKLELFDYEEFDGEHEWRGDIAWKFLAKYLNAKR